MKIRESLRLWWMRRKRTAELRRDAARLVRSAQEDVPLVDVTRDGRILTRNGPPKVVIAPEMVPFGSLSAPELEARLAELAGAFNGIPYPHRVKWVAVGRAGGWEQTLRERQENVAALTGPERHLAIAARDQLERQIKAGVVRQRDTYIVAEHDSPKELSRIADYLCRAFRGRVVTGAEALAAERLAWRGTFLPDSGMWIIGGTEPGDPEMVVVGGKATVRARPPDPVPSTPLLLKRSGGSAHEVARKIAPVDNHARSLPHG
jgi:hypothetical protein